MQLVRCTSSIYAKLLRCASVFANTGLLNQCMSNIDTIKAMPEYHLIWESRFEDLDEGAYIEELKAHCTETDATWIEEDGYEGFEDALKAAVRSLAQCE